jgi:TIR domain
VADGAETVRKKLFISKATPGDDVFALWLAPRLEAAGYEVFADILDLDTGDSWRTKLTATLQNEAAKLLLCCSNETLVRRGVLQEIGIAADLTTRIPDPNFIMPLRMRDFRPVFGIVDLQYIDFEKGWATGLEKLLKSLERQNVPRSSLTVIQPEWAAYHSRQSVSLKNEPEILTSNWLRILSVPNNLNYIVPSGATNRTALKESAGTFDYPVVSHGEGYITFATTLDFEAHFSGAGGFKVLKVIPYESFAEEGADDLGIEPQEASNMIVNLLRQAWEKHCKNEGFLAHQFSNGLAQIVQDAKVGTGQRIPWGKQGQRRNSMLRNISKRRLWEYGVSARVSLFPFPHYRLKSRVLFSDIDNNQIITLINEPKTQHRLRRSIAGSWRNKAWHGRLMAFLEVLAGESPYVALPLGGGAYVQVDAMPIQATSPVSAQQMNKLGEDGEEIDLTTLGGHFGEEDV